MHKTSFSGVAGVSLLLLASASTSAQPPHYGPPPEALEACSGQTEGASCQFEGRRRTVSGTCQSRQNEIICVPSDRPKQGRMGHPGFGPRDSVALGASDPQGAPRSDRPGGPPPEAYSACEGKSDGQSCTVETPHGRLEGVCHTRDSHAFCVPNRHPQRF
jgi:hypothetical protein